MSQITRVVWTTSVFMLVRVWCCMVWSTPVGHHQTILSAVCVAPIAGASLDVSGGVGRAPEHATSSICPGIRSVSLPSTQILMSWVAALVGPLFARDRWA